MRMKHIAAIVSGALAVAVPPAAMAQARYADDLTVRVARAPDWDLAAPDGQCRLRVWVDDRARVQLRGEQIVVSTESGRRSFDQGSVCTQPLPFHRVEDFRVTAERSRGSIVDVEAPNRRNNFTGLLTIDDPQAGGEAHEVVIAWHNPDARRIAPLAVGEPYPYVAETRACQDRVRADFFARNRGDYASLEFTSVPARDDAGPSREIIRGEAWARNRHESRPITYECVVNERSNRVVTARYEVVPRRSYSSLY